ncbi:MAG TPA: sigma-54 dependent transcriptional regulator, partial [Longimicrobiales bacterium]|nr:sigma-54 dependent transcriptional regulator [Longimicrobiales bacterium]
MRKHRILVCDDEMLIRLWLEEHLRENGYEVESVGDGAALLQAMTSTPADLVLLDLRLPDGLGIDLIPRIHAIAAGVPIIMMTAYGEVQTAVAAVRAGAHHFMEKPVGMPELLLLVEQALEARGLHRELEQYREGFRWQFSDVTLVGRSHAVRKIAELVMRLALKGSAVNVLIRGESGCGKDVIARALHARGPRAAHPFIAVNCSALPEHLVESELFGHDAGAFTDARTAKQGLFELAHRGTIFLDEIGDMPPAAQAKLLAFLETRRFRRVGGIHDIEVDAHVVAATNRELEAAVATGLFREDLFYRLNVIPIEVPPLRERPEDVAPLAQHFLERFCRQLRQPLRRLDPDALAVLEAYPWPGNARQLGNTLERVLLLTDDDPIRVESLPPEVRG